MNNIYIDVGSTNIKYAYYEKSWYEHFGYVDKSSNHKGNKILNNNE